jgi:hypothetical protein
VIDKIRLGPFNAIYGSDFYASQTGFLKSHHGFSDLRFVNGISHPPPAGPGFVYGCGGRPDFLSGFLFTMGKKEQYNSEGKQKKKGTIFQNLFFYIIINQCPQGE